MKFHDKKYVASGLQRLWKYTTHSFIFLNSYQNECCLHLSLCLKSILNTTNKQYCVGSRISMDMQWKWCTCLAMFPIFLDLTGLQIVSSLKHFPGSHLGVCFSLSLAFKPRQVRRVNHFFFMVSMSNSYILPTRVRVGFGQRGGL